PWFMSAEWRVNFRHAVREAARLGIEMGVNLCSGWGAGGPWVTRDDAIKSFAWTESTVEGGGLVEMTLPRVPPAERPFSFQLSWQPGEPIDYCRDIAVLACREDGE